MKSNRIRTGSLVFNTLNITFILIFCLVCLIPFLNIIALSLSSPHAITTGKVSILPVEFQFQTYLSVFKSPQIKDSFIFTVALTVIYTILSMIMTIMAAYPLSRRDLKGKKYFFYAIIFTMYFQGGMIPNYLLVNNLHLINSIWSLVLPGLISAFNLIILKTSFSSIPASLLEAAYLDGCSDFKILLKIVIPLSMPILATMCLFYAVGRWNGFTDSVLYINNPKFYTLQVRIREIVLMDRLGDLSAESSLVKSSVMPENLKAATVMVATLPILIVYPWLQKYFISGIMIGSIKE